MGWTETCSVDERMRFVLAVERREEAFAALCRRFGVSRKTGYKWLDRYRAESVAGLIDRSRAPHAHPQAVSAMVAERCLAVRRAHPTWGPVKVRAYLERGVPATPWPAATASSSSSSCGTAAARSPCTCRSPSPCRTARSRRPACIIGPSRGTRSCSSASGAIRWSRCAARQASASARSAATRSRRARSCTVGARRAAT